MPWRKTRDPYKVWLSEIILQQTRVDQGMPYYLRFVALFPTIHDLANAESQLVMKTWEGLGYYSRARNLHATAKFISEHLNGVFPVTYAEIVKLKGIGPYTAAAIASICFDEVTPVIDGNVFRFISRHFGVERDIAEAKNRKYFEEILTELIDHHQPGTFNQAVMEFGATVCKPAADCESCVFISSCFARAEQKIDMLPIKTKKVKVAELYIHYLVFEHKEKTLMRAREEGIWHSLFEFPSIPSEDELSAETVENILRKYSGLDLKESYEAVKHILTHRKLWVSFQHIEVKDEMVLAELAKDFGFNIYTSEEVLTLPLPKVIVNHLQRVGF